MWCTIPSRGAVLSRASAAAELLYLDRQKAGIKRHPDSCREPKSTDLNIRVPPDASGTLDLGIALVDLDGTVLADRCGAGRRCRAETRLGRGRGRQAMWCTIPSRGAVLSRASAAAELLYLDRQKAGIKRHPGSCREPKSTDWEDGIEHQAADVFDGLSADEFGTAGLRVVGEVHRQTISVEYKKRAREGDLWNADTISVPSLPFVLRQVSRWAAAYQGRQAERIRLCRGVRRQWEQWKH
jgi:hypothetical protein